MVIKNDTVEYILNIFKICVIAIIGFILSKAWLSPPGAVERVSVPQVHTSDINIDILILLVVLCVAIASWICGYLYNQKKMLRNSEQGIKNE